MTVDLDFCTATTYYCTVSVISNYQGRNQIPYLFNRVLNNVTGCNYILSLTQAVYPIDRLLFRHWRPQRLDEVDVRGCGEI
jgi:hypothetical protein